MPQLKVFNVSGEHISTLDVSERVFDAAPNQALVHQAVVCYQANQRQGTVKTLSRGEVSGGGRKPYRQKGTGRARQGSTRAPHWYHGGVVFGPKPREWRQRMPQKMRQGALRCVLSAKLQEDRIRVVDDFGLHEPQTKAMIAAFKALALERRVLVVLQERDDAVLQSVRNIPGVQIVPASILNTYDVISADWVLTTETAVRAIEEKLS